MAIKFTRGIRDIPRPVIDRTRDGGLNLHAAYIRQQRRSGTCCFIHINTCGGTSVERTLGLPPIHDTSRKRRDKVGRDRWNQMVKFSLVRRPDAKVCSHYRYRRDTGADVDQGRRDRLERVGHRAYDENDPRHHDHPSRFRPCADRPGDENGTLMMDFVCRLGSMDADQQTVEEMTGVTVALPKVNCPPANGAPEDLLEARSKAITAGHFRADVDLLGYIP